MGIQVITTSLIMILILNVVSIASASPNSYAPKLKIGQGTSSNWAGYAVDGAVGSVSDVTGSWTVPKVATVKQSGQRQYSSFWVGIDGDSSSNVEQIGTDSDIQNNNPVYYVWYELYPNPCYRITSMKINPGDKMTTDVSYDNSKNSFNSQNYRYVNWAIIQHTFYCKFCTEKLS